MNLRPERLAQSMKREIAEILEHQLNDPRLGFVTITEVDVARDLRTARVYVSVLETGEARERALAALRSATGFVRHQLAPRLDLREIPELRFIHDASIERGARVEELLRKLERGEPVGDDEGP